MASFKITVDGRDFIVVCLPNRPKALLDRTVAEIYEVPTKQINQAVKRNPEKFPEDFCFELTFDEFKEIDFMANSDLKNELVTNCDQFEMMKHSYVLPKAFTHLGCNMLATVLKSPRAVQRAIQIIRTFTALESGAYDYRMDAMEERLDLLQKNQYTFQKKQQEFQKQLEQIHECQQSHQKQIQRLSENLDLLLWNNQPENSPILQIQQKIHNIEEKVEILLAEKNLNRLQIREIYADIQSIKGTIENEVLERCRQEDLFYLSGKKSSFIYTRLVELEKKLEKICPGKEGLSSAQIGELKAVVGKKAKGNRKKMAQIWNAFKKQFHLSQYKHLPQTRFDEALEWIKR